MKSTESIFGMFIENKLTFCLPIQFTDFKNYAMSGSIKDNPKLERSIALFNGLSQWIQCMVLSKTTPQQRADVIVKFVNVAKVNTDSRIFFLSIQTYR